MPDLRTPSPCRFPAAPLTHLSPTYRARDHALCLRFNCSSSQGESRIPFQHPIGPTQSGSGTGWMDQNAIWRRLRHLHPAPGVTPHPASLFHLRALRPCAISQQQRDCHARCRSLAVTAHEQLFRARHIQASLSSRAQRGIPKDNARSADPLDEKLSPKGFFAQAKDAWLPSAPLGTGAMTTSFSPLCSCGQSYSVSSTVSFTHLPPFTPTYGRRPAGIYPLTPPLKGVSGSEGDRRGGPGRQAAHPGLPETQPLARGSHA